MKDSLTTSITAAGQIVPYTFFVSNTGNVTVTGITVTDPKVPTITCEATSLTAGASMTCTGNHTVTQAEMDAAEWDAREHGDGQELGPGRDGLAYDPGREGPEAHGRQDFDDDVDHGGRPGRAVHVPRDEYRQRDGDGHRGHRSEGPNDQLFDATSLTPGASMTCTGDHTVTQAELDAPSGTLVNTVTVKSSAPDATDTNTILVAKDPRLTVDKTSTTTSITAAGQVVPYTFLVTNTGNVTVTGIAVTDPKVPTITCDATSLAPGISMTCTGSHTVTLAEMDASSGTLVNTVTVKSSAPDATDSNTIPVSKDPKLTVVKDSTTTSITAAGQVVPYRFLVTNTGNVTVTGIAVTDPKVPAITCEATSLAPGISMTCTGNHTVTLTEMDAPSGTLVNTVTVKSSAPDATDTHTIPVAQDAGLSVVKDVDDDVDHGGRSGRAVRFLVTNTGNVTVTGITVTDPKVPTITCEATSLAPTAFMTCTGSHTVTLAEMDAPSGTLVNTVTVKSSAPDATETHRSRSRRTRSSRSSRTRRRRRSPPPIKS